MLNLRLAAKLPQVGKGLQDGFLRHILRIRVIAQQGQRGRIDPAFVGLHQFGEEGRISVADAGDERCSLSCGVRSLGNRHSSQHLDFLQRRDFFNDGVILRDFSPEGSCAHRQVAAQS